MSTADTYPSDPFDSSVHGAFRQALAPDTELDGGKYLIERVLGEPGGFGITYLAKDVALDLDVAIKEYLPRELVARGRDGLTVEPDTPHKGELFQLGLDTFVDEARRLARFEHPHIVGVRAFFRQHGTAYMVMQYYRGRTLDAYLQEEGGRVPEKRAVELILPVLDALCAVQAEGMIHRDVKPQNIYLTDDGRPILLDFGAARVTLGERSSNPTRLVSRGFAAPEQYFSGPTQEDDRQGPWTDVYGVAATLYRITSGRQPPDALDRRLNLGTGDPEPLTPLKALAPQLSADFCAVVEQGLSVPVRQRPQNAEAFRRLLRRASGLRGDAQGVAGDPSWDETPVRHRQPSPPVARELRPRQPKHRGLSSADQAPEHAGPLLTPPRVEIPIFRHLRPDDAPPDPELGEISPHTSRHWQDDPTRATTRPELPMSPAQKAHPSTSPSVHESQRGTVLDSPHGSPRVVARAAPHGPERQAPSRWRRAPRPPSAAKKPPNPDRHPAQAAHTTTIGERAQLLGSDLLTVLRRRPLLSTLVLLVLAVVSLSTAYELWMPREPGLYLKLRFVHVSANERLSPTMVRIVDGPAGPPQEAELLPELNKVCTIDAVWGGQRITLDDLTFDCP